MMSQRETTSHVSSFDLDLLEAGGLDADKKRAVDEHLRTCAVCRQEHETLRRHHAEFGEKVLPRTMDRVRERVASERRLLFTRPSVLAPVLASAAAFALWVASGQPGLRGDGAGDDAIRAKGKAEVQLVARHNGRVTPLDEHHRSVAPGDEIRFIVTAADRARPYLLIASVDGTGRANFYFPYDGKESGQIERAGRWEVPGSIVLDASPGPERIFAIFSKEPLARDAVARSLGAIGQKGWDAIRAADRLDLDGVEQTSFLMEKSPPGAP